jgi:hypothetical protein
MPFSGLMPSGSGNHQQQMQGFDKNSAAALNQNWFTMAQMAAQDYFSRLQMSGMMHPDLANLSALGNLASYSNVSNQMNSSSSSGSGSKNNLKRKDKMPNLDMYDSKKTSSSSKDTTSLSHQSKNLNYNQSYPSTANLQKDFMTIAAAAAAASFNAHEADMLNEPKHKSSSHNNYVPSKSSNSNHNSMRAGSSNSNSRKNVDIDKLMNSGNILKSKTICILMK